MVPKVFNVGDLVHAGFNGFDGIVICIDSDGWCGVQFPGWEDGHNLGGMLKGDASIEGYWVHPSELEIISTIELPPTEVFEELF